MKNNLLVRHLGRQPYEKVWQDMMAFTDVRTEATPDEFWLVEHDPVYTLGQAGRMEHVLAPGDIPVIQSDRGGQVTFHGPGQIVGYLLLDLRRSGIGVRELVTRIENAVIQLLEMHGVHAESRREAPGVYVAGQKIAALGLRIRRGRSYHGLSLNVDMDLTPFDRIDPCGYPGLDVTDMRRQGIEASVEDITDQLEAIIETDFGYHAQPGRKITDGE